MGMGFGGLLMAVRLVVLLDVPATLFVCRSGLGRGGTDDFSFVIGSP